MTTASHPTRYSVRRSPVWSATIPRHHMTHQCIAELFAAESGLGEVTWFNRGRGPAQFHVSGCRQTYEVERSESGGGPAFKVARLTWGGESQEGDDEQVLELR